MVKKIGIFVLLFSFAFIVVHDYAFAGLGHESGIKTTNAASVDADTACTIHADIHHLVSLLPEVHFTSVPSLHSVHFSAEGIYTYKHPTTLLDPPISA